MSEVCGWAGKILQVDLSTGEISHLDTMRYVPKYIGGLGVAAKIAWDELKPGVGAFDPENLLMIMVGPLTGTLASGAGRVEVAGIAPQQKPEVYSRSGMGGHWGAELKYAGYDGVIIRGRSEKPVYLWIEDGKAELRDASQLWGKGTFATTTMLRAEHGPKTRVISCGQAGERLARIACIQSETGNAAGQGGYGAVMGSKRLKAIAVRGTGGVKLARPEEFLDLCLNASKEGLTPAPPDEDPFASHGPRSGPDYRTKKCGFCASSCNYRIRMNVPGVTTPGTHTVAEHCWGYSTTSENAETEGRALTSDYGLNGWEIAFGIIPWLQMCKQHGLIDDIDGISIPVPDKPIKYLSEVAPVPPELISTLVRKMARREGELGDALADGACYAAEVLFGGQGKPLLDRIYPRRAGQTEHWAGNWGPGGSIYWPWWLPIVLQWCVDTRDPANDSSHQWTSHVQFYLTESGPRRGPFSREKVRAVCQKVYGNPAVGDPDTVYEPSEAQVIPAIWHSNRGMIVNSLVLCDYEHTRVFSMLTEDGAADTAIMAKLLSAATGFDISEQELDKAGNRIWNLQRALDVRNYGRDRSIDESTLNAFDHPGKDDGVTLDFARFKVLLHRYYQMSGWNPANGWPTREKLEELGLGDVADELEQIGRLG